MVLLPKQVTPQSQEAHGATQSLPSCSNCDLVQSDEMSGEPFVAREMSVNVCRSFLIFEPCKESTSDNLPQSIQFAELRSSRGDKIFDAQDTSFCRGCGFVPLQDMRD